MRISELNPEEILCWMERCFSIYPKRGIMIWRHPPKVHPRMKGREAGCARKNGNGKYYIHIRYNGMALKRGWLIFLWVHGDWPRECIDHINGKSHDDRISNLREATITQNAWNHKSRRRRIKLPMGIRKNAIGKPYAARIGFHGKQLHLGAYKTVTQARRVYLKKRRELYGQFA